MPESTDGVAPEARVRRRATRSVQHFAVASVALVVFSAYDVWQVVHVVWVVVGYRMWSMSLDGRAWTTVSRRVSASLAWGMTAASLGLLASRREVDRSDGRWVIEECGFAWRGIARLRELVPEPFDCLPTRRFGYERLFEWDEGWLCFATNVLLWCAAAYGLQAWSGRAAPRWLHVAGALVVVPSVWVLVRYLHVTRPLLPPV